MESHQSSLDYAGQACELAALREALNRTTTRLRDAEHLASDALHQLTLIRASRSWRITLPLRIARTAYVELMHWMRPERRFVPRLRPLGDVILDQAKYRSIGSDPAFLLEFDRCPPSGPCTITIELAECPKACPKLYVDQGAGFSENSVIAFPLLGRVSERPIVIPANVRALRFDPVEEPATFRVDKLEFVQLGLFWVGLARFQDLLKQIAATGGGRKGLMRYLRIAWSLGFSGIKAQILQRARDDDYDGWLQRQRANDSAEGGPEARQTELGRLKRRSRISVIMPTFNTPEAWLREAIESVRSQSYPDWELCVADDASTDPTVQKVLAEYASLDGRIKFVIRSASGHIAAASNSALQIASGEFVAFLDHDDLLATDALFYVAREIDQHRDVQLIYSDEDKIDANGKRFAPYFKCDWNYDLFLGHNLISHLGVYRAERVRQLGGFRQGFDGSQDYDLALRFIEGLEPGSIRHIPRVLYHWRAHRQSTASRSDAKPYAFQASMRAIQEHLRRIGIRGTVDVAPGTEGMHRVTYDLPRPHPLVSIIVPTRNQAELLNSCLNSIFNNTDYAPIEVILVDNGTDQPEALSLLTTAAARPGVRVIRDDSPFNFSALNNRAVAEAKGEFVLLLNNDVQSINRDWLAEMISHAARPGVGAVGARLWYPDNSLQHGGVILGQGGVATHMHHRLVRGDPGYVGKGVLVQNFCAVTGACLAVRRDTYLRVGGLDEGLPIAYNDVDFCLRLMEAGYRNVWVPNAELYHHESVSRGSDAGGEKRRRLAQEEDKMRSRWKGRIERDPFCNPNLSYGTPKPMLRWPESRIAIGNR